MVAMVGLEGPYDVYNTLPYMLIVYIRLGHQIID